MQMYKRLSEKQKRTVKIVVWGLGILFLFSFISTGNDHKFNSIANIGGSYNRQTESSASKMAMPSRGEMAAPQMIANDAVLYDDYQEGSDSIGSEAESFEVTRFYASIESRDKAKTCDYLLELKSKEYVVFNHSNNYERGCNLDFKVKKQNKDEILSVISDLRPKDFSEQTNSIKKQVDDYISRQEILTKKLETIDSTLLKTTKAYDEITAIAARNRDAQSLAKIIESKLQTLERLTREQTNILAQLEAIQKQKSEELDKLEYVYFSVNVFENKIFDGTQLVSSWKQSLRGVVFDTNRVIQQMTIHLITFAFVIAQYALYIVLLLLVAKFGLKHLKDLWKM